MLIKEFGVLPNGDVVTEVTLKTTSGFQVKVLTLGGAITEILAANRSGNRDNIVLCYDTVLDYLENPVYLGVTIGRLAGRVAGGKFSIDGHDVPLDTAGKTHALHGGRLGIHAQNWSISKVTDSALTLVLVDRAMMGKPPGNVTFEAEYKVEDESLRVTFKAQSDAKTLVNLTNHSYFNLTGHSGVDVKGHTLKLKCDAFAAVDEGSIPYEQLVDVTLTPFDFRASKLLGLGLLNPHPQIQRCSGFDHPFQLFEGKEAIVLSEPLSGRVMTLSTNQPYVVIYSGNFLNTDIAPSGKRFKAYEGICFETQDIPNGPNRIDFKGGFLEPGEEYRHETVYTFSSV